jgi:hypothetical protein
MLTHADAGFQIGFQQSGSDSFGVMKKNQPPTSGGRKSSPINHNWRNIPATEARGPFQCRENSPSLGRNEQK